MPRAPLHPKAPVSPLRRSTIVWLTIVWLAFAGTVFGATVTRWFDVPGGDALDTLKTFAAQAGGRLLYSVDAVAGVRTQPVRGEMSATDALAAMMQGTTLTVAQDSKSGALVVRPVPVAERVTAAAIAAVATANRETTAIEQMIRLPTFTIQSERDPRYVGAQAASTTRTGADLVDLPQSVRVLNKAFLDDVNPTILAKALLYVGGAQTGTINWSADRYMMRGFVGEGDYVDGFRTQTDRNTDLNLIDHVEIIKGPAAIFLANQSATVGGVINKITKSPTDYPIDSLTVQIGLFDANRADIDLGGPVTRNGRLLWRFLAAAQDSRGYYDHTYEKRTSVLPMLAYRFSDDTEAWIKFEAFDSHYSSYNGLPLDARTGKIVAVPGSTNYSEDNPLNWRTDWFTRLWGQFATHPFECLAVRIAAFDSLDYQRRVESILAPVGATTPTRQADGSFAFSPYPQYVIPPDYATGQNIARGVTAIDGDAQRRREIQNDYVFTFAAGRVSHRILLGGGFISYPQAVSTYSSGVGSTATTSGVDPFAARSAGAIAINLHQAPTNYTERAQHFAKLYALETAGFFHDHLMVSFGATRSRFDLSTRSTTYDQTTQSVTGSTFVPHAALDRDLVQYGVVLKPRPHLAIFYGYNENFSANPIQFGAFLPPQKGVQHEFGIKSDWFGGALNVSINRFHVTQENNSVAAYPQTTPPSQVLVPGTRSEGWDGDFTLTLNRQLDVIGSFAWMQAHVPLPTPWNLTPQPYDGKVYRDVPVNNASERNLALWAHYKFNAAKGLSVGVGVSHLAKRAITDNSNLVFYGYVPPTTHLDAVITYRFGAYKFQLNVDNALDTHDLYAVRSDQVLIPDTPLNLRLSVTRKL